MKMSWIFGRKGEKLVDYDSKSPLDIGVNALDFVLYPKGSSLWKEVRSNLQSGLTVGMVSLPLSLSLATASGATPLHGIVSGFWSGLVSGLCGGSHYNIVGPTGALSGLLGAASSQVNANYLSIIAILSGLMILLLWAFKLVRYLLLIPTGVVEGFTLGVAIIIGVNQLNSILGLSNLPVHESFIQNTLESLFHIKDVRIHSLIFFSVHFTLLMFLIRKWPKIPWSIFIAWEGVGFGLLCHYEIVPFRLTTLKDRYGAIPIAIHIPLIWENRMLNSSLLPSAFGCSFIAVIESLISARIADGMTNTHHNQQREVLGLGLANLVGGLMGGIPSTAALARTALNIKSGATSRMGAIISSLCVLGLGTGAAPLFQYLPMPTIAALLVMVAIRMVELEKYTHLFQYDRTGFIVSITSALVCIIVDTVAGLLVGALVSFLIFADHMSKGYSDALIRSSNSVATRLEMDQLAVEQRKRLKKMRAEERACRMRTLRRLTFSAPEVNNDNEVVPQSSSLTTAMDLVSSIKLKQAPTTTTSSNHLSATAGDLVYPLPLSPFTTVSNCLSSSENVEEVCNEVSITINEEGQHQECHYHPQSAILVYRISGQLNYLNAKSHLEKVRVLAQSESVSTHYVCIALRHLYYIDLDGVDALRQFIEMFETSGKTVFISGAVHGNVNKILKKQKFFLDKQNKGYVFDNYKVAMEYCSSIQDNVASSHDIGFQICHG